MFVGHYGPAGLAAGGKVKLWHGFFAVQFLDILWAPFILTGLEKVRIVEGFTASNHLDLYHMPYTHSLVMALFWSCVVAGGYGLLRRSAGLAGALIMGALVFSHWIADLLMHKPDLEIWIGGPKLGFGLWEYFPLSMGVEILIVIIGMGVYIWRTEPRNIWGRVSPALLGLTLLALQVYGNLAPPPPSADAAAQSAIIAYGLFILLAAWVDNTRRLMTR